MPAGDQQEPVGAGRGYHATPVYPTATERCSSLQAINKSLSALGDVIASLQSKNGHVPYRNSKLTQVGSRAGCRWATGGPAAGPFVVADAAAVAAAESNGRRPDTQQPAVHGGSSNASGNCLPLPILPQVLQDSLCSRGAAGPARSP